MMTYLHPDILGSPRRATDMERGTLWQGHYDPYGKKVNSVNEKIGYTGHAYDPETQYTYMQARFYDPQVGRFLSTDPVSFSDKSPFTFNRYVYGNNNPYKYTDPNGEEVNIVVERTTYTDKSVSGTISVTSTVSDKSFSGHSLETTRGGDNGDKPPIAEGTYDAGVRTDHTPNRVELKGVEGRTNIQIHNANKPEQLKGCIAPGTTAAPNAVGNSKNAMNQINDVIKADGSGKITVEVRGSPEPPPPREKTPNNQ